MSIAAAQAKRSSVDYMTEKEMFFHTLLKGFIIRICASKANKHLLDVTFIMCMNIVSLLIINVTESMLTKDVMQCLSMHGDIIESLGMLSVMAC